MADLRLPSQPSDIVTFDWCHCILLHGRSICVWTIGLVLLPESRTTGNWTLVKVWCSRWLGNIYNVVYKVLLSVGECNWRLLSLQNCQSADNIAMCTCCSIDCASSGSFHPVRYCLPCHHVKHLTEHSSHDHLCHTAIPDIWACDPELQGYLVDAIVRSVSCCGLCTYHMHFTLESVIILS